MSQMLSAPVAAAAEQTDQLGVLTNLHVTPGENQ